MVKAVVFDMFETLVTLFRGRTYFGEDIAADTGADPELFRKEWHAIEKDRSTGKYTIEEGLCKPDPELFRRMTEALGVMPSECLYVGDGGSRELFAARDAGMHPVQCTWFHGLAFEPHVPCPVLDGFDHAASQAEIPDFCGRY